jgi:predicted permease
MVTRLFRRIWYLLNRRRLERELEREMAAHRAEMGEPRRFGGTLRLREQSADAWGWMWLDELWQDLRYGLRQLRRTPGFTLVAALTLAVGIGANATAFGVVKAVLLAELPMPEPRTLRQFAWDGAPRDFSEDTFRHLQAHASGFSALTCVSGGAVTLGRGDRYEQARAVWVSGAFSRTFPVAAARGRALTPADDLAGAPPVAVLSYEAWQRQFGADPSVVGSVLTVDDAPVTVVGVVRRGFTMTVGRRPPDLWLPVPVSTRAETGDGSTQGRSCRIIGRLSPGRAEALTRQESELVLRQSGLPLPSARTGPRLRGAVQLQLMPMGRGIDEMRAERPGALRDELPQIAGALFLLLAVLIVPCANVAAMLLARAITRRPEIVARLALGASRRRLVRQLLTEGALLSALAGAAGVLMSWLFISNLGPPFALDLSVLAVTATLCALATLSFALAPALTATRGDLASRVRESSAGTIGRVRGAPGAALVAVQVLVSCMLLAVAGFQARTLLRSVTSVAIEPERVLIFETHPGRAAPRGYVQDALRHLHALPGVVSAAAASPDVPQVDLCEQGGRSTSRIAVWLRPISPGYFTTLKIPMRQGRDIAGSDSRAGRGVVIINGALARALFGTANPVGRELPIGECELVPVAMRNGVVVYGRRRDVDDGHGLLEPLTVVGVVPDTFNGTDVDVSSGRGVSPTMYLPYEQLGTGGAMTFAVRAAADATLLATPARRAMQQAAPGGTVGAMQTQAAQLARRSSGVSMLTAVYVLLGLLAMAQAAFGLYGTVSQFVNRRTAEIGLRLVLGARAPDVLRMVVRQALTPVVIGLVLGLASGPIVARVMRAGRLIAEPGWVDLLAVPAGVSVLMAMACAASSMPAWRVSRMDPAAALREE